MFTFFVTVTDIHINKILKQKADHFYTCSCLLFSFYFKVKKKLISCAIFKDKIFDVIKFKKYLPVISYQYNYCNEN